MSRVSIGSAIAQLTYGTAIHAITELAEHDTFDFLSAAMDHEELEGWFAE